MSSLRRLSPPLHLLRAFSMVTRFGSVSRAAEALHLTQSAVSKQVKELEGWVGVALFERSRKRLALTPAGERYEKAVRAVLANGLAGGLDAEMGRCILRLYRTGAQPAVGDLGARLAAMDLPPGLVIDADHDRRTNFGFSSAVTWHGTTC